MNDYLGRVRRYQRKSLAVKRLAIAACRAALIVALLTGASGLESLGSLGSLGNVYNMLGGSQAVTSIASGFVDKALKDPRLAGLVGNKKIDAGAVTQKVSDQLCSLLGGSCKAPLTKSQLASAAGKVSPDQSKAISDNFNSALNKVVSDPLVRDAVTKALGNKVPGVLAGLL